MRRAIRGIFFILFFCIFSAIFFPLHVISQVDPYLTDGEKKKLEKADAYNDEANKKVEEANALYLQISELQAMEGADEKKIKKMEGKAVALQVEALELNQEANEGKIEVYRDKIDKFLEGYSGDETSLTYPKLLEEQANEEFYKANQLKSDAKNSDSEFDVYLKYLEAQEAELKGIEHQEKAIEAYMNVSTIESITYEEPVTTTEEPVVTYEEPVSTYEEPVDAYTHEPESTGFTPTTYTAPADSPTSNIVFDEYQMEIIKKLQSNEIPEGTNFDMQSWDMANLQAAWDNYQQGLPSQPETQQYAATDTSTSFDTTQQQTYDYADNTYNYTDKTTDYATDTYDYTDKTTDVQNNYNATNQTQADQTSYVPVNDNTTQPTDNYDNYTNDVSPADLSSESGTVFRVQIAADKQPLNQSTLRKIYYGNNTIEMLNEEGWYKYSIGDFSSYAEANSFRNGCGVYDAFIVAYKNGRKLNMASVRNVPSDASHTPSGQIIFKVQIAATKSPMSNDDVNNLYNGSEQVQEQQEEGWYKYSIGNVTSYQQAVQLKKQSDVTDAFIVAYMNGRKLNLYQAMGTKPVAVQRYAEISPNKDIIFGVQIAASRAPISMKNLSILYKGDKTIVESTYGGWFRYRIDLGKSFEETKRFKNECGIKGAFIVAHQNGKRVKVKDAINLNK